MTTLRSALIWRGILAVIVGVVAVVWPGITVGAFVVLFAIYAFITAGTNVAVAFRSDGAGRAAGSVLVVILNAGAGIAALAWPGITALAFVWIVAIWAFAVGVAELAMAFAAGESFGERALFGLGGLVPVALGVDFAIRPDIGAVTIAQVYGLFSLIAGFSALVVAANTGHERTGRQSAVA